MQNKLVYIFLFFHISLFAQINLVPNPSFEDTINCPQGPDEVSKCKDWSRYKYSPDYFNSCDISFGVSTPINFSGYQIPKSGNAYVGVATYITRTQFPNFREYIGAKLTSTLVIGQKYFFSMRCVGTKSSMGPSNCYSDKLGVNFSKVAYSALNPYPIKNSAKVSATAIINDTVNWTMVKGSFVSDSSYQYIILGNFYDDNFTDTLIFDGNTNCLGAYYFIDDVCLSTDSSFTYNYIPTKNFFYLKDTYKINIYPNPVEDILYVKNVFEKEYYNIINSLGVVVKQDVIDMQKSTIDVSELINGVYFLQIQNSRIKIIITHKK